MVSLHKSSPEKETSLEGLARLLPSPRRPLSGVKAAPLALPENIICFRRATAGELGSGQQGRSLHHRFVLAIALQGEATIRLDNEELRMTPGSGVLVLPFQFHDFLSTASTLLWLFVTFEHRDVSRFEGFRNRPFPVTKTLREALLHLVSHVAKGGSPEMTVLRLSVVLQLVTESQPREKTVRGDSDALAMVSRVNSFTLGNQRLPSVKEIARRMGVSASHLRTRFCASCGVSIARHLRQRRLERAGDLVRHTDLSVSEVAEQCGYGSVFSFSRAFRQEFGCSPLAYRRSVHAAKTVA